MIDTAATSTTAAAYASIVRLPVAKIGDGLDRSPHNLRAPGVLREERRMDGKDMARPHREGTGLSMFRPTQPLPCYRSIKGLA